MMIYCRTASFCPGRSPPSLCCPITVGMDSYCRCVDNAHRDRARFPVACSREKNPVHKDPRYRKPLRRKFQSSLASLPPERLKLMKKAIRGQCVSWNHDLCTFTRCLISTALAHSPNDSSAVRHAAGCVQIGFRCLSQGFHRAAEWLDCQASGQGLSAFALCRRCLFNLLALMMHHTGRRGLVEQGKCRGWIFISRCNCDGSSSNRLTKSDSKRIDTRS